MAISGSKLFIHLCDYDIEGMCRHCDSEMTKG